MAVITPATSRAFVKSAKLPAAPPRRRALADEPPLQLKATDAQSLVVGSGLVVAAEKVPVQVREDLINCSLFAQLAATGTVGGSGEVSRWYDAYFGALTTLGWAQSETQFEDYEFSSKNAEAHQAVLKVLTVLLGPQAAALVVLKAAVEALGSMQENSPWITLFERNSKAGRSARFQVATAQLGAEGLLQTALVGFELKTKSTLTQVLFFKFSSSSTSLKYAAGKATIYEAALKDQREAIAARLAAYRSAYVGQITLPPPPGTVSRSAPRRRGAARRG
jgi:hypothetical protein